MQIGRIGFACKFVENTPRGIVSVPELNTKVTTIKWLTGKPRIVAEQRLWELLMHNLQATYNLVERVSNFPPALRMVRVSSDLLPAYTHKDWRSFWQQRDVVDYCERNFAAIGALARKNDVRLSFHPGQFCVLASANDNIVENSIEEFEYHATMARWMGYGATWHDHGFKINVHIAGKRGPQGIIDALSKMSPEARNLITIENEEISYGIDDCLTISEHVAIVLDGHHHWVNSGDYISAKDSRVQRVIDSWRGVRPTMHYSISREDVLVNHCDDTKPNLALLTEAGHKKQKLRAHSDFYWNTAVNDWILTFADRFDIMCESKSKNLASTELYNYALGKSVNEKAA
jgi:UV DNA damage repair endonuclease